MFGRIQRHHPQHRILFTVSQILSAQKLSLTPYPHWKKKGSKEQRGCSCLINEPFSQTPPPPPIKTWKRCQYVNDKPVIAKPSFIHISSIFCMWERESEWSKNKRRNGPKRYFPSIFWRLISHRWWKWISMIKNCLGNWCYCFYYRPAFRKWLGVREVSIKRKCSPWTIWF